MPEKHLQAWRAFLEAHAHVVSRLATELEHETALPLTWYDVLVQLSEAEENRLRMTELADRVLLRKSGLTRLVDRMCAAGLVDRSPDADDRRGRWVEMTEAGRTRLVNAAPIHLRGVRAYFTSYLSEAEAAALESALERIAAASRNHR
jgi:DNA-binding MarR family transcriptional regulator